MRQPQHAIPASVATCHCLRVIQDNQDNQFFTQCVRKHRLMEQQFGLRSVLPFKSSLQKISMRLDTKI